MGIFKQGTVRQNNNIDRRRVKRSQNE